MSNNYFNPFFTVKTMDGLFISNQTATKDQQFLANNKFALIVNTCPLEFKVPPITHVYKVMNFHWQNSRGTMIDTIDIKLFKPIFDQITKNLNDGFGVLVVSDRGHSRAITFVLLYLMHKFAWELFKALEYINSKRENLEVRAAYLKLLVSYEKRLKNNQQPEQTKAQLLQRKQIQQPSQLKQCIRSGKQNWSEEKIRCPQEQLLSNTFKNTLKKHRINELNQEYREMLVKEAKEDKEKQKKPNGNYRKSTTGKDWNRKSGNSSINGQKKVRKKVQFSNEIQIIIKESSVTQFFPQYQQLSPEHGIEHDKETKSAKLQQLEGIHSHQNNPMASNQANNSKGFNMQRMSEGKNYEQYPLRKKEHSIPNVTNSRMINIRRMEKSHTMSNSQTAASDIANNSQNYLNHKQSYENQFIILDSSEDSYSNEVTQVNRKTEQLKASHSANSFSHNSSAIKSKQKKDEYFIKQPSTKTKSDLTTKPETPFKTQQLLTYQIRPSSLKKFKAIFIDEKQRKASSPKKKQRQEIRILTEPKYDHEFDTPMLEEDQLENKTKKRLSDSPNDDQPLAYVQRTYQHKKTTSTTIATKMMNRFQKKQSTPIKNQKRCPPPHIVTGESHKEMRSSSHNNFFTRPLSRGGSNSLKMATKKSATSAIEQQGTNRGTKLLGTVFNVNINVNIGKLEMFGTKNMDPRESISRSSVNSNIKERESNKEKLPKAHSLIDKSQLLYNRMRSNSSNDNYSKFSVSSGSISEKQDAKAKFQAIGKEGARTNAQRQHSYHEKNENQIFVGHSALIGEEDNIFASDSFSKKEIMEKINRKLVQNSRNSKIQEHSKKGSILENNFV